MRFSIVDYKLTKYLMKTQVPPIKIQWIKTKLIPWICEKIWTLRNEKWIEPFMGSWAVWFNIAWKDALFWDTNPHLINFYNHIKEWKITKISARLFLEYEWKKLSKWWVEYYNEVRSRFNELYNPLDFLFLNRSCFNGIIRFNGKWLFNVPFWHKPERFAKSYVTKIVNQIGWVEEKIHSSNWEFRLGDFSEIIKQANKGDIIYCDPPYIARHSDYFNKWTEEDERTLKIELDKTESKYIVSSWLWNEHRKNEFIQSIWNDCSILTKDHFYHVGAKEANRKPMEEALLSNF